MESIRLISSRLLLRPIHLADASAVFQYRSNHLANRYQGWIPETIADVDDFIVNRVSPEINEPGTWFQFVIIIQDTGELIGDIGVHFSAENNFQVELGITLNEVFQGNGYATEALREIISYLFNHLGKRRITASIDPRNLRSVHLFERLGFRREAHFRESLLINGEWVDDLVYAILRNEWNTGGSLIAEG